ncbi:MAG: short chain dehydrogenase [Thermomonas sp.]
MKKRVLVVGASGVLGRAVVAELGRDHEVVAASRTGGDLRVDLRDDASVAAMYAAAGRLDAVVCTAGNVHFGELAAMTAAQFDIGLQDKLLGQVRLALIGQHHLADGGSITLTTGILGEEPIRQGANATAVNAAVEGFVRTAALELQRGQRINAISPNALVESWDAYAPYFPGFEPVPAARAALAYRRSVDGIDNGRVLKVW